MTLVFTWILAARYSKTFSDLEKSHGELVVLDRLKDDFLTTTTHELRTPLHGIMGLSRSLSAGTLGPVNRNQKHDLDMIHSSAEHLNALVGEILDYSKIRAGRADLFLEEVDVAETARTVLSLMRAAPEAAGIELRDEIEPGLPPVTADRGRLRQVLVNLVGNAVKYTEKGKVTVALAREPGGVRLEVRDTGRGIAPDALLRVFEPFVQEGGPDERPAGGTGLDLAITRRLVELHGGTISARSEVGKGSAFIVRLPFEPQVKGIARVSGEEAQAPPPKAVAKAPKREERPLPARPAREKAPRILAVDDDLVNLRVVWNVCMGQGYELETAANGRDCLAVLETHEFDLVILDLMLPGMSGYEVCERIRERPGRAYLPVVMVTARDAVSDLVRGFSLGANDYVTKPFTAEELVARIENQLAIRQLVDMEIALTDGVELDKGRLASLLERSEALKETALQLIEWEKIIKDDLDIAYSFQRKLMTRETSVPGIEEHVWYSPLQKLGGDVFDMFEFRPGVLRVFLADTTGHGIQASLNTVKILAEYAAVKETLSSPEVVVSLLNRRFVQYFRDYQIVFSCVVADIDTAKDTVALASAGHPEQFIIRNGAAVPVKPPGPLVGVSYAVEYPCQVHALAPGDMLLLYTDGLFDLLPEGTGEPMCLSLGGSAFMTGLAALAGKGYRLGPALDKAAGAHLLNEKRHKIDDVTVVLVRRAAVKPG